MAFAISFTILSTHCDPSAWFQDSFSKYSLHFFQFNLWFGYAVCSYSLATYIITSIWYNMKTYLLEHYVYVLGYLVVTGSVSFGICYRMGPVENVRTLNLIQWAMQFVGLVAVFCSSSHQAASLSIILGKKYFIKFFSCRSKSAAVLGTTFGLLLIPLSPSQNIVIVTYTVACRKTRFFGRL